MARYIDADNLVERLKVSPIFQDFGTDGYFIRDVVIDLVGCRPTADVVPKSEVERLQEQVSDLQDELYSETETNKHLGAEYIALRKEKNALNIEIEALKIANEKMYSAIEATKNEVIEEYRQRVNTKMGKHTHLLGKEYVQRIMREVAKEMKNEQR